MAETTTFWAIIQAVQTRLSTEIEWNVMSGDSYVPLREKDIVVRESMAKGWDKSVTDRDPSPGIVITLPRIMPTDAGGECSTDDIIYQLLLQFIDKSNTAEKNIHTKLYWYQQIRRAFTHKRFPSVPEVCDLWVSQIDTVDEKLWTEHDALRASFVLSVKAREFRTVDLKE